MYLECRQRNLLHWALHSPLRKIILIYFCLVPGQSGGWTGHSVQTCLFTDSKGSDKTTYWLSVKFTRPNGNPEVDRRPAGAEDKNLKQNSCSSTLEAQGNPIFAQISKYLPTGFRGGENGDVMVAN